MEYHVIDAFTNKLFSGNPAGVCLPDNWPPDDVMQKTAAIYIRNGEVEVRVPLRMPKREIDCFVLEKESWILKSLAKQQAQAERKELFVEADNGRRYHVRQYSDEKYLSKAVAYNSRYASPIRIAKPLTR